MASPIEYLIHPNHPPPSAPPSKPAIEIGQKITAPVRSAALYPGLSVPFNGSEGRAPAPPPLARSNSGSEHGAAPTATGNHSKTQSLYQCADCLRRYSRPEHLQRHIAAHTLGKRFTCDICSKGFARADLLKRHRANHQDDNGPKRRRFNIAPSASRVAHACQACAKARVKCEEIKPCTRCKNRGLACEVSSSEDAAACLVHLSANINNHMGNHESTPDSCYASSLTVGQPQYHASVGSAPSSFHQSASPEESKEGIVTPANLPYPDDGQLATPDTSNQSIPDYFQSYAPSGEGYASEEHVRPPFPDFLGNVLYNQPLDNPPSAQGTTMQQPMLDFYDDANLDFKEFDFGLLDHWTFDATRTAEDQTAGTEDSTGITAMRSTLAKIWTDSPWRWSPQKTDSCFSEQSHLPLPSPSRAAHDARPPDHINAINRVTQDRLQGSCRDKILAIVLGTCRESRMASRVASSFPSVETMDSWINIFLAAHLCQVSSWAHYGSFSLNSQCPEWLAMAAAAGAVLTPAPPFRRFGYALQEAIRVAIPEKFDENNKNITELDKVQALVLVQDVGLWSGNRRKMEIAECHLSIPIAMMRYRGKFGASAYPDITVYPSDEGRVLEEKWKRWYQLESWKRLVFHAYLRDAQVSMIQCNNPSMSYAELTLPLPCSKELWFARSAEEFKIRYLESGTHGGGKRLPTLGDLFRNINALSENHHRLDVQFGVSIYLHGFWSQIWEYRQLSSVYSPSSFTTPTADNNTTPTAMAILLDHRRTDLQSQLKSFQAVAQGWHEMLSARESMLLHLLLLNLHVSIVDLQLFLGKEGEDQARRVYPALQRWAATPEARQALWHAAQVFRQGRMFPRGHLKDFWSVAVSHASLCVWTYGVVVRASRRNNGVHQGQQIYSQQEQQVVCLDGEESEESSAVIQGWILYGQGRPAIRGVLLEHGDHGDHHQQADGRVVECLLEDPAGCMAVAQEILRANFVGVWESLPPLSENVILVLKQLEKAAWAVGLG
ncbi:uncharacterized protein B0T15DRAFT_24611 [Chaetomium strumarium]|uniref:Uncharacterized protein n=1 Tax=Chaetomium strumarium TaxID=1170767 RepID=A0AAJ0H1Q1_9PEZI|nr:hypothetical protein B0T15DRAFT_24611 [Chaetomium strumarium]